MPGLSEANRLTGDDNHSLHPRRSQAAPVGRRTGECRVITSRKTDRQLGGQERNQDSTKKRR